MHRDYWWCGHFSYLVAALTLKLVFHERLRDSATVGSPAPGIGSWFSPRRTSMKP